MTDELNGRQGQFKGPMVAIIKNVARDNCLFQTFDTRIVFYSGKDERLLDYRIETRGNW